MSIHAKAFIYVFFVLTLCVTGLHYIFHETPDRDIKKSFIYQEVAKSRPPDRTDTQTLKIVTKHWTMADGTVWTESDTVLVIIGEKIWPRPYLQPTNPTHPMLGICPRCLRDHSVFPDTLTYNPWKNAIIDTVDAWHLP